MNYNIQKNLNPPKNYNINNNNNFRPITPQIETKMCEDGKYEGELKNGLFDGKGTFILKMEIDMKDIGKKESKMEEEHIIIVIEIDMKENGEMEIKKEKEYIIISMVIDMKEIGKIIKGKEME